MSHRHFKYMTRSSTLFASRHIEDYLYKYKLYIPQY